jgi:hypothetical protein
MSPAAPSMGRCTAEAVSLSPRTASMAEAMPGRGRRRPPSPPAQPAPTAPAKARPPTRSRVKPVPLALLVPPRYEAEAILSFAFAHARDHEEIDTALFAQKGVSTPTVPLDPMPDLRAAANWLLLHQQKHNAMNEALGLDSSDMTGYDLSTEEGFSTFAGENFSDHDSARQALNI